MHKVESLPDHFVMVLQIGRMEDPEQKIRGKLTGVRLSGDTWAVLSHVLGAERKFTRILADGTFEFTGFFAGHYQVQAVSREGPLACGGVLMHAGDGWVGLSPRTNCANPR